MILRRLGILVCLVTALLVAALASSAPADSPIALASATCADYSNRPMRNAPPTPATPTGMASTARAALPVPEAGRHKSVADSSTSACQAEGVLHTAVSGAAAELQQFEVPEHQEARAGGDRQRVAAALH
jgi:hypothetical protein